jgi:hypothetical protein
VTEKRRHRYRCYPFENWKGERDYMYQCPDCLATGDAPGTVIHFPRCVPGTSPEWAQLEDNWEDI